jgi:hypothetical protein
LTTSDTTDRAVDSGKGVMAIICGSDFGNVDANITCGLGITPEGRVLTPKFNGIPVEDDRLYGFTCKFQADHVRGSVTIGIRWYDKNELFLGLSPSSFAISVGTWLELEVQDLPVATAEYAIPYLSITGRAVGDGYTVMGAMFYLAGYGGIVEAPAPDLYLTLGSDELIGLGGKVIGG